MFERPETGEAAILVNLSIHGSASEDSGAEFRELAVSAGARPVAVVAGARSVPEPRYFVGKGKAEEIRALVEQFDADLVLVNHPLTPAQERNLERLVERRVIDRTGIILDIFAQRASTFEGKLQVELAQLRHLSTRLIRGWTHLERQKGGIGLRGPGETQLETDRRLIGRRIRVLNERLEKVRAQRQQSRRSRRRVPLPQVALVGYTNAGKSTLFNRLSGASVYVADQLFATLDPTLRRLDFEGGHGPIVLSDTVGFISELPHDLVAAFRATLEEAREAELLLHVIDCCDENRSEHMLRVYEVLQDIGAGHLPRIEVFNKIDRVPGLAPRVERDDFGRIRAVWVSALTGSGLEGLSDAISGHFDAQRRRHTVRLQAGDGKIRARLYQIGAVHAERLDPQGAWILDLRLRPGDLEKAGLTHLHEVTSVAGDAPIAPDPSESPATALN